MSRKLVVSIFLLTAILHFAISSTGTPEKNLNAANPEINRVQIEKAIAYYRQLGDSLKFEALRLLITNMSRLYYEEYTLIDSSRVEVPFDVMSFTTYDDATEAMSKLATSYRGLHFELKKRDFDIESVRAEFIINNIELAFKAWRTKPWARSLPFRTFEEYILPYRGSHEKLSNWREYFYNKFRDVPTQLEDPTDPVAAARVICKGVLDSFQVDSRFYYRPTDLTFDEMMTLKHGRCEDVSNMVQYAGRANGIVIYSDFVPCWANAENNHIWNVVRGRNGKAVSIETGEDLHEAFALQGKAPKIYRTTFSDQKSSLAMQIRSGEEIPPLLILRSMIDVTKDYVDVADVDIDIPVQVPTNSRFAYLCVFNSGSWKPVDWARINKGHANFRNIGKSIVYCPAFYVNSTVVPFGDPFLLDENGETHPLTSDSLQMATYSLKTLLRKEIIGVTVERNVMDLDSGATYELYYWKNGWKPVGSEVYTKENGSLVFQQVPVNQLYWLVKRESAKKFDERIFTIQKGKQVWW